MAIISETAADGALPVQPRRGIVGLTRAGFGEMTGRWRLIRHLVTTELKRTHADTALGQIWWLLDPVLQMLVYYFLFAVIFQRKTPDFLLFLFAAILPWKWFSTTVNASMWSVVGRQALIRQVQFPKLVLPTAATVAGTISFAVGLIALAILLVIYHDRASIWVLAIPVIASVQFVLTLAVAIVLAAANAFYRDVANVMDHVLRLVFYISPALYALWDVPGPIRPIMRFNPFSVILSAYRTVIWGTETVDHGTRPDFVGLGIWMAISLVLLVFAVALFKRVEPTFARIL